MDKSEREDERCGGWYDLASPSFSPLSKLSTALTDAAVRDDTTSLGETISAVGHVIGTYWRTGKGWSSVVRARGGAL
jgi:hypothetical protein